VRNYFLILLMAIAGCSAAANAEDANACPNHMVCASNPDSVVAALHEAGFGAKLVKNTHGEPLIASAAHGYRFAVAFYGCVKNEKCDALHFRSSFSPELIYTLEYTNSFISDDRYLAATVTNNKEIRLSYDITTVGGLNKRNFAEVTRIWAASLEDFSKYSSQQQEKMTAVPSAPQP
jgi:Putative bacterial sensory transduction regulator